MLVLISAGLSLSLVNHPTSIRPRLPELAAAMSAPQSTAAATALPELSHDEIRRYSRHLILDQFGVDGQRKLKGSKILCIGSGGLGSPALMYLAAAGMGTIGVVDDDVVDESNLQRQIIHSTSSLDTPKVDSAEARVTGINPHVNFVKHNLRITPDNALDIIREYDLVLDGSDNFPTRYLVNDACVILDKPLIYGAIQKFEGQVSVFNYRGGPNYRDLFPEPPPPGEVPSCAEGGVLGVLPGVIGCMQATEAIKVCLGVEEGTLSGRLLLYDAMRMRFHEVRLKPTPNAKPITSLVNYDGFCGVPSSGGAPAPPPEEPFVSISAADVSRRMTQEGWKPFVLDVRSAAEAKIVSFPFADMLQPHRQVSHVASVLPRDRDILVHCKGGIRSKAACQTLADLGFEKAKLYSMDGGIIGWAKNVDKSMPLY